MDFVWYMQGTRLPNPPPAPTSERRVSPVHPVTPTREVGNAATDHRLSAPTPTRWQSAARQAYEHQRAQPQPRRLALHAHQIMSAPVATLAPESGLSAAWAFIRARRYRHVPVLSHDQQLLGILSDRDLWREAASLTRTDAHPAATAPAKLTVRDVMTTPVLTATPQAEIRQIAQVLFERHIGAMPVVDQQGCLVGMITRSDILRTLIKHAPLDLWI